MVRPVAALLLTAAAMVAQRPELLDNDAAGWPRFRGPNGQGRADGTGYPLVFGPERSARWSVEVGPGHSSPCVVGGRVFYTSYRQGADGSGSEVELVCRATEDGAVVWRQRFAVDAFERHHDINGPASSTPVADGERVWAYFGSMGLVCCRADDGRLVWTKAWKPARNTFGSAASPVLGGGHLLLLRDTNEGSFLVALDPATGQRRWRVDREGVPSGWSTPVVWNNGGTQEVLAYGAFQLTAYDLATGEPRWSVPGLADEPCTTPILGDGLVYVTSYNMRTSPEAMGLPTWESLLEEIDVDGDGAVDRDEAARNKSVLSRVDADGEGDHPLSGFFRWLDQDRSGRLDRAEWQRLIDWLGSFEHANALVAIEPGDGDGKPAAIRWQQPRGVPECPSPVLHGDRIYLVKNGGLATCVDAASGELRYHARLGARGPRYASPVVAGGHLYAASARGQVTVWKLGDTLEVVAHNDLGERIMATPAFVGGVIYVRTAGRLYAFAADAGG